MIGFLVSIFVIGGIITAIVQAATNRGEHGPKEPGTVHIRRLFQYATLLGVMIVVAVGLTGVVEQLLPDGRQIFGSNSSQRAQSLAFLIVGVPVYVGLGAWVRRQLADPIERSTFGWSFYVTTSSFIALMVTAVSGYGVLAWVFGAEDYDAPTMAAFIVWLIVWVAHWWLARRYLGAPRGEGHLLAGSSLGLVTTFAALGAGIAVALEAAYRSLFEVGIAGDLGDDARFAATGLVVGGLVWWWYWLRHAIRETRTPLWHSYVLLLGVLSGLLATIGSVTTLLYLTLEWFIGDPESSSAVRQFSDVPGIFAAGLIGLILFVYHRAVLNEAADASRTEIRRIYEYTLAAVGLVSSAAGVTVLLIALIQQLTPSQSILPGASEVNTLLAAATLLGAGGPLWFYSWSRIQRLRAADPAVELQSITRRVYLILLFGLGGITALVSLIAVVYGILEDVFDGRFGSGSVDDAAVGIALVVTSGVVAGYHWLVYREDRDQTPAGMRSPLKEVVLLGVAGTDFATSAASHLDVRVASWTRLDGVTGEIDTAQVLGELESQTAERVVVIAWEDGYKIVPFERR